MLPASDDSRSTVYWKLSRKSSLEVTRSDHFSDILLPTVKFSSGFLMYSFQVKFAFQRRCCTLTVSPTSVSLFSRSTDTATCVVRRSNNSFIDWCFAAAGPRLWNMLPIHLPLCDGHEQFKRLLKTNLFGVWDRGAL